MQKNGIHENVSYNSFALSPRNDKKFCFIDSWGRHVQKIVNHGYVAGGGHCL